MFWVHKISCMCIRSLKATDESGAMRVQDQMEACNASTRLCQEQDKWHVLLWKTGIQKGWQTPRRITQCTTFLQGISVTWNRSALAVSSKWPLQKDLPCTQDERQHCQGMGKQSRTESDERKLKHLVNPWGRWVEHKETEPTSGLAATHMCWRMLGSVDCVSNYFWKQCKSKLRCAVSQGIVSLPWLDYPQLLNPVSNTRNVSF